MNLANIRKLDLNPENRTWFRVIPLAHATTILSTSHTINSASRFSAGSGNTTPFEILYLAESINVAMLEVQALLPGTFGSVHSSAGYTGLFVAISVSLSCVVDISEVTEQATIETTCQELTGDWRSYAQRTAFTSVRTPIGMAPTQSLGQALYNDSRYIEGFRYTSAKLPTERILAVFPTNMRRGSRISYSYRDVAGRPVSEELTGKL